MTTPPAVTIEHWIAYRYAAGDVIERWSIAHQGRTLLTYDNEIDPREACKRFGWAVAEVVDLGWLSERPDAERPPWERDADLTEGVQAR